MGIFKKGPIESLRRDLLTQFQNFIDRSFNDRRRTGRVVLFLFDGIGNHHFVDPAVKEKSDQKCRKSGYEKEYQGKTGLKL